MPIRLSFNNLIIVLRGRHFPPQVIVHGEDDVPDSSLISSLPDSPNREKGKEEIGGRREVKEGGAIEDQGEKEVEEGWSKGRLERGDSSA